MGLRALARRVLPPGVRRTLRRWAGAVPGAQAPDDYAKRLHAEQSRFDRDVNVHELPEIFHYWSNRHLAPRFNALGFGHPDEFFAMALERAFHASPRTTRRFVSIGAGNCDTEVRVAKLLAARGVADFVIECVELSPAMLERGRELARAEGVERLVRPVRADFNAWRSEGPCDAVMANQSLHHVTNLEGLFDAIAACLDSRGLFVTSDMIGRNGHQRWPEALAIVREFWRELPRNYRYNHQLARQEDDFLDWDCAQEGFEGIRAQDVLPLLVERFGFDLFAAFANVIDPFIDRGFGHNFDALAEWDRTFIDRVHARDDAEIRRGAITPTHLFAVMCVGRKGDDVRLDGLDPRACIRRAR